MNFAAMQEQQRSSSPDTDRPMAMASEATSLQAWLGRATVQNDPDGVNEAVNAGADPHAGVFNLDSGEMGGIYTAVFLASFNGCADALHVLLSTPDMDPDNGLADSGQTPCHMSCLVGRPSAVKVLIAHGADPNRAANQTGFTPCMWAAYQGHTACLQALAEGAARRGQVLDVNAMATGEGWKGKTALDMALDCNNDDAAKCLRDELGALRAKDVRRARRRKKKAQHRSQQRSRSEETRNVVDAKVRQQVGADGSRTLR